MITPDTHVYCTKCKWLRFCNEDIPYCISESKCDIEDFEDSRPFKERPCYEEINWEAEYHRLLEIVHHYEVQQKYGNLERLLEYGAVREHNIRKESNGKEDIKSDIMYKDINYIINSVSVQPAYLGIYKNFSSFEYRKTNGDSLEVKVYKNGSVVVFYCINDNRLSHFLKNFDGLDEVIYSFFKSQNESEFLSLITSND